MWQFEMLLKAARRVSVIEADRLVDQDGLATVEQLFQALPKSGTGTARLQVSFSCGRLKFRRRHDN